MPLAFRPTVFARDGPWPPSRWKLWVRRDHRIESTVAATRDHSGKKGTGAALPHEFARRPRPAFNSDVGLFLLIQKSGKICLEVRALEILFPDAAAYT